MSNWKPTRKSEPCAICGATGWCAKSIDGTVAKCMHEAEGAFKTAEDGSGLAHFHRLVDDSAWRNRLRSNSRTPKEPKPVPPEIAKLAAMAHANVAGEAVEGLASELGLTPASLRRLGVGWVSAPELERHNTRCMYRGCWTFPMRDTRCAVIGVRLRSPDGPKYAVKGSHQGLFIPAGLGKTGKPYLLIAEGPTDTAALLDMGFDAIGRPSNTAGTSLIRSFVATRTYDMDWPDVVLIIDRDQPGSRAEANTRRGADILSEQLRSPRRCVRICQPPDGVKDARDWLATGANEDDVLARIVQSETMTQGRYDWIRERKPA